MNLHLEIESADRLERDVWRFFYHTGRHALVCQYWSHEQRATLRHKFKPVNQYDAYRRYRTTGDQPAISPEVAATVLERFTADLRVEHFERSGGR